MKVILRNMMDKNVPDKVYHNIKKVAQNCKDCDNNECVRLYRNGTSHSESIISEGFCLIIEEE